MDNASGSGFQNLFVCCDSCFTDMILLKPDTYEMNNYDVICFSVGLKTGSFDCFGVWAIPGATIVVQNQQEGR